MSPVGENALMACFDVMDHQAMTSQGRLSLMLVQRQTFP